MNKGIGQKIMIVALLSMVAFGLGWNLASKQYINQDSETISFWFEQNEECNHKLDERRLETLNWKCTEYKNKTTINVVFLETCCIGMDLSLVGIEEKSFGLDISFNNNSINETTTNVTVSLANEFTEYGGAGICFDVDDEYAYESISIGNKSVNMTQCAKIPQLIETNETICVKKEYKYTI